MTSLPQFRSPQLLMQAMTHKSFSHESSPGSRDIKGDNERLEFLGDAILTFLVGELLYKAYDTLPEGALTPLRASLVDKTYLAKLALQLQLDQKLRLGKGVEQSGGRQNPRLLSSAFEALIGAYYLDQQSAIAPVRHYIEPLFTAALSHPNQPQPTINHKSRFQEWALATWQTLPEYIIVSTDGPDHNRTFRAEARVQGTCYGQGQGNRKQAAEKAAAEAALDKLGLL